MLALVAFFSAGTSPATFTPPPSAEASIQTVTLAGVSITVPRKWDVRPLPSASTATVGIQASKDLARVRAVDRRAPALEAWWVDATKIPLPSDYYYLAAEGPGVGQMESCTRDSRDVALDRRPRLDRRRESPGDYVATASGTCEIQGRVTRWASFVAAPGFGPVRQLGIPQSGLYFASVMLPEGPQAARRVERMLTRVTFGGTGVTEFLEAAHAQKSRSGR
jgi:hypothetical protein